MGEAKRDEEAVEPTGRGDDEAEAEAGEGEQKTSRAERKERVLHTRIPAVLEAELKAAAVGLRIPVSNLVRTILEDAVALADRASGRVEDRLNRAARSVQDERRKMRDKVKPASPLEQVVAYQPVVIAQETSCAACDAPLAPGADALLAILEKGTAKLFVCKAYPGKTCPRLESEPVDG